MNLDSYQRQNARIRRRSPHERLSKAEFRRSYDLDYRNVFGERLSRVREGECMMTLDKRISLSQDHLDRVTETDTRDTARDYRKTPFEMFLDNDGPYSKKLYATNVNQVDHR